MFCALTQQYYYRLLFIVIQFVLQVNGAIVILCVKTDFLQQPGANGQNTLQNAVSNATPHGVRTGVCPALGSSSWHHLNVSYHNVLHQCLKLFIKNNDLRKNLINNLADLLLSLNLCL